MSSTFHVDLAVVVFKPASDDHRPPLFLLLEETAESNVFDAETGNLCPSWSAIEVGERWQVMTRIVQRSSDCEGGMLKFRGKYMLPEGYIKRWRDAIVKAEAEAKPGLNVPSGVSLSAAIRLPLELEERVGKHAAMYPELRAVLERPAPVEKLRFTERQAKAIPVQLTEYTDFAALARLAREMELALWHHVSVQGPSPQRRRRF
jgi:hypothetical protein